MLYCKRWLTGYLQFSELRLLQSHSFAALLKIFWRFYSWPKTRLDGFYLNDTLSNFIITTATSPLISLLVLWVLYKILRDILSANDWNNLPVHILMKYIRLFVCRTNKFGKLVIGPVLFGTKIKDWYAYCVHLPWMMNNN